MSRLNDGGPAFPESVAVSPAGDVYSGMGGMSLRDWFAGQALTGLLPRSWDHLGSQEEIIRAWAQSAYAVADAMLTQREKDGAS